MPSSKKQMWGTCTDPVINSYLRPRWYELTIPEAWKRFKRFVRVRRIVIKMRTMKLSDLEGIPKIKD